MDIRELEPIITMLSEQEERLVKKINEVHDTIKVQNSRIGKSETRLNEVELDINTRTIYCERVQDEKGRAVIRNRWIIGTLLVILGLLSGMFYKVKENNEVPVELIYQKTDSTYIMPSLYMRRQGGQEYFEVHKIYIDIAKEK